MKISYNIDVTRKLLRLYYKIFEKFNTQEKCINYLNVKRWEGEKPYCGSDKISTKVKNQSNHHQYSSCQKSFTALLVSIFEGTKISLSKIIFSYYNIF